jgi:hypothetical protein
VSNASPVNVMPAPRETVTAAGVISGVVEPFEVFHRTPAWLSMYPVVTGRFQVEYSKSMPWKVTSRTGLTVPE